MTWKGEGRRPYSDKKQEKDRFRKLTLALLQEPNVSFLETIGVFDEFIEKTKEAKRLAGKHVARRRAERRMVELLRSMEEEMIESIESMIGKSDQIAAEKEQRVIAMRSKLLSEEPSCITNFISQYPQIDVQKLRQCIRNVKKEIQQRETEQRETEQQDISLEDEKIQHKTVQSVIPRTSNLKLLDAMLRDVL